MLQCDDIEHCELPHDCLSKSKGLYVLTAPRGRIRQASPVVVAPAPSSSCVYPGDLGHDDLVDTEPWSPSLQELLATFVGDSLRHGSESDLAFDYFCASGDGDGGDNYDEDNDDHYDDDDDDDDSTSSRSGFAGSEVNLPPAISLEDHESEATSFCEMFAFCEDEISDGDGDVSGGCGGIDGDLTLEVSSTSPTTASARLESVSRGRSNGHQPPRRKCMYALRGFACEGSMSSRGTPSSALAWRSTPPPSTTTTTHTRTHAPALQILPSGPARHTPLLQQTDAARR